MSSDSESQQAHGDGPNQKKRLSSQERPCTRLNSTKSGWTYPFISADKHDAHSYRHVFTTVLITRY